MDERDEGDEDAVSVCRLLLADREGWNVCAWDTGRIVVIKRMRSIVSEKGGVSKGRGSFSCQ